MISIDKTIRKNKNINNRFLIKTNSKTDNCLFLHHLLCHYENACMCFQGVILHVLRSLTFKLHEGILDVLGVLQVILHSLLEN